MRVSAGFLVIGLSGNKRIHTLPPRLIKRVIAIRAASIWRDVIQPHSMHLSAYSPNAIDEPRQALPFIRPRCTLRYLTFLGINIVRVLPKILLTSFSFVSGFSAGVSVGVSERPAGSEAASFGASFQLG